MKGCVVTMPIFPSDESTQLAKSRDNQVFKANELVRKARYNLTTQQQKIILYIISKIKPDDDDLKIYRFDMREFARLCGIDYNGKNYANFRDSIQTLRDKSFWMDCGRKKMLISWFERVEIDIYETTVSLRLDDRLKPYLIQLQENFTAFSWGSTLLMDSKHSIRLYEILKSYQYLGIIELTIEEIKEMLDAIDIYPEYKDFRRYVIDKAMKEINELTEINVSYQPIKQGRSVYALLFTITEKDSGEQMRLRLERDVRLNGKDKHC